ncbi:MAG: hypothetical protein J0H09_28000 [Burkholderiales bacterium]|nr:hypothetical protein [Burkholderiales bacterium]
MSRHEFSDGVARDRAVVEINRELDRFCRCCSRGGAVRLQASIRRRVAEVHRSGLITASERGAVEREAARLAAGFQ